MMSEMTSCAEPGFGSSPAETTGDIEPTGRFDCPGYEPAADGLFAGWETRLA
jgi:hypothetical protein